METIEISLEQIVKLLPDTTSLVYVDYRDDLSGMEEKIQEAIHKCEIYRIEEEISEAYWETEVHGEDYLLNELKSDLISEFDIDDDYAQDLIDEYEYELKDEIRSRCDDDTLGELISNTGRLIAHYDTGYEVCEGSWNWSDAEIRLERINIKKHLKIVSSEFDESIDMMIRQASYGGQLLIYFNIDIEDFLKDSESKSVSFTNACIGIVDHFNGSGDVLDTDLSGHTITMPLNRENIFLEETIKYNWTYSIAGMCADWCDSTEVKLHKDDVGTLERSHQNNMNDKEKQYNNTFKDGSCTFGDMDITRHRNTEYRNDYPCGNKCKDCGTFWVD